MADSMKDIVRDMRNFIAAFPKRSIIFIVISINGAQLLPFHSDMIPYSVLIVRVP